MVCSGKTMGKRELPIKQHPPDGRVLPIIQIVVLERVGTGIPQDPLLLQASRACELVHGGVGLHGGVVRRGDAVARLTAVVAVPVIHGTVSIFKG